MAKDEYAIELSGENISTAKCDPDVIAPKGFAIRVNNLVVSYGKAKVLDGAEVSVPWGGIYALLGPSGCGKTTLLKCILGQIRPKKGEVTVFGEVPGSYNSTVPGPGVGFMPQEAGLFHSFTVEQTLLYFGKLSGAKTAEIEEKMAEVLELLELPRGQNKLAGSLSGGEKRRLSLAVTLINNAPLLVLDEPTCGIDILLQEKIWKHLIKLTNERALTVVITTHYISEAKDSNVVAFMRAGRVISETTPSDLFRQLDVPTLDEAFLKLCKMTSVGSESACQPGTALDPIDTLEAVDNKLRLSRLTTLAGSSKVGPINTLNSAYNGTGQFVSPQGSRRDKKRSRPLHQLKQKWYRVSAHVWKNYVTDRNLKWLAVLKVLMVLAQAICFPFMIGGTPNDLDIDVFNGDNQVISNEVLDNIDADKMILNRVDSRGDLARSLDSSFIYASIYFPPNYTYNIFNFDNISEDDDSCVVEAFQFQVDADVSNLIVRYEIEKQLYEAFNRTRYALAARNQSLLYFATAELPYHKVFAGDGIERSALDIFSVNSFLTYIFFVGFIAGAIELEVEKGHSFLERTVVAGLTLGEMFVSFIVSSVPHVIIQSIAIHLLMVALYQLHLAWDLLAYIFVLQLLVGVSGHVFGLFLSSLALNEAMCGFLLVPSYVDVGILIGGLYSTTVFPPVVYYFSKMLPATQSIWALRYLVFRHWPITNFYVIMGYLAPVLSSVGIFALAYAIMKYRYLK